VKATAIRDTVEQRIEKQISVGQMREDGRLPTGHRLAEQSTSAAGRDLRAGWLN
jgi:DNA-binding FadR family transcriptional regulator